MRFTLAVALCIASSQVLAENLNDIYRAAVINDPVMRAAEAKLRSDEENYKQARSLLLPQIAIQGRAAKNDTTTETDIPAGQNNTINGNTPLTQLTVSDISTIFSASLRDSQSTSKTTDIGWQATFLQPLFNMSSWYTFKSSKKAKDAANLEFIGNQHSLIKRSVESYLNVLRAKDQLASSRAEETALKQNLEQTQQRFDVGLVAITEVHESQAAYDLAKVNRLLDQGRLSVAYESLTILTGKSHTNIDAISEKLPIQTIEPADIDSWVQTAKQNNTELQQSESTAEAAKLQAKSSASQHLPTVALTATISENENTGEQVGRDDVVTNIERQEIALVVEMPIYTGGRTSAARRQAYANYDQAREQLLGVERSIVQQTRANYIAVLTRTQQVIAQKKAITSAQSALDAVQAGYDVGTRNIVDVLDAQRKLFNAQRDYANARYDYILSYFELKEVAGTLTPADITWLNQWMTAKSVVFKNEADYNYNEG